MSKKRATGAGLSILTGLLTGLIWVACLAGLGAVPPSACPDFDRRRDDLPLARELPPEKASAGARLRTFLPELQIDWEPLLQTPKYIRSLRGFLVADVPGGAAARAAGGGIDRLEPVKRFLQNHRA